MDEKRWGPGTLRAPWDVHLILKTRGLENTMRIPAVCSLIVCLGLLLGTRALAADDDLPPAMIPATPSAEQDKTPAPATRSNETAAGKAVATDSVAPQTVAPEKKEIEKKEPEKKGAGEGGVRKEGAGIEGGREGPGPEGAAKKGIDRRAGRTPRPHPPHLGFPSSTAVQHPRQHGRRYPQVLLGFRLPERGRAGGCAGPEDQRHHLPLLGPSLQRLPPVGDERQPHCRPRRLRSARRSVAVPGDAGECVRAEQLSAPRRPNGPHRGRPDRIGEARLPSRDRPVAEVDRPVLLRRRSDLEEQPGRDVVGRADRHGGIGPSAGRRSARDHAAAGA